MIQRKFDHLSNLQMTDIIPIERITNKTYAIRDTRIMLGRDFVKFYAVETKALKKP